MTKVVSLTGNSIYLAKLQPHLAGSSKEASEITINLLRDYQLPFIVHEVRNYQL